MDKTNIETKDDYIINSLYELFIDFVSIPPNKRTKKPTITLTQEQAINIVRTINAIVSVYNIQFVISAKDDGTSVVEIKEIEKENEVE